MRILKPLLACLIGLGLSFTAFPVFSADSKISDEEKKQPIEIKSEKMRSENEGKKIIFTGNVVSTWGDLEIKSDILEVYANPQAKDKKSKKASKDKPQQDLDKVIAIGNVRIKKGDRRAKGDRADYDNKTQSIVITGDMATAWEGKNEIKGKKMIFYLKKNKFEVPEGVVMTLFPDSPPPATEK